MQEDVAWVHRGEPPMGGHGQEPLCLRGAWGVEDDEEDAVRVVSAGVSNLLVRLAAVRCCSRRLLFLLLLVWGLACSDGGFAALAGAGGVGIAGSYRADDACCRFQRVAAFAVGVQVLQSSLHVLLEIYAACRGVSAGEQPCKLPSACQPSHQC